MLSCFFPHGSSTLTKSYNDSKSSQLLMSFRIFSLIFREKEWTLECKPILRTLLAVSILFNVRFQFFFSEILYLTYSNCKNNYRSMEKFSSVSQNNFWNKIPLQHPTSVDFQLLLLICSYLCNTLCMPILLIFPQ